MVSLEEFVVFFENILTHILTIFLQFNLASCMRVALESNIIEILREHPEGLHVTYIAALNGMHPNKICTSMNIFAPTVGSR